MSAEWKPGDVAVVDGIVSVVRPLVVIDPEDREQVERLAVAYTTVESARSGDEYRAWENRSAEARGRIVDGLAAALREFANPTPPKPEEPTGLGAVVEDADGARYVRDYERGAMPWALTKRTDTNGEHVDAYDSKARRSYADIAAVKVLSEGVTP